MKIKKSILLMLFLLCILMFGAVSASENSTTDTSSLEQDQKTSITEKNTVNIINNDVTHKQVEKTNIEFNKTNFKTEKSKLKSSTNKKEVLSNSEPISVDFYNYDLYNEDSNIMGISTHGDSETGDLNIYVNNSLKKTYAVTNGNICETSYLPVKLKDIGIIEDGTYQVVVKLKQLDEYEVLLKKHTIKYEYSPVRAYYSINGINIDSNINENGTLKIYVNNSEKKTYELINGKIQDGTTYGTQNLVISYDEIINKLGIYNIIINYKSKNSGKELTLNPGLLNNTVSITISENYLTTSTEPYHYSDDYYYRPYPDHYSFMEISDNKVITGTLKIYVNNREIDYTGIQYINSSIYLSKKILGLNEEGVYNIKVKFINSNNEETTIYDKNLAYVPSLNITYPRNINNDETATITVNMSKNINGKVFAYINNKSNFNTQDWWKNFDYNKNDKLGSWDIINGSAQFELTGNQINSAIYKVIILQFTTNMGNFSQYICFSMTLPGYNQPQINHNMQVTYLDYDVDLKDSYEISGTNGGKISYYIKPPTNQYLVAYNFRFVVLQNDTIIYQSNNCSSAYPRSPGNFEYTFDKKVISPGTYRLVAINNYDSEIMDVAILSVSGTGLITANKYDAAYYSDIPMIVKVRDNDTQLALNGVKIKVEFPNGITNYYTTDTNGEISFIPPLGVGTHTITISSNDSLITAVPLQKTIIIRKASVNLDINNNIFYLNNPANFSVNVTSNNKKINEGNIKFYINNEFIGSSNVVNGIAQFNKIMTTTGTFNLMVVFDETSNYLFNKASTSFTVNNMPQENKDINVYVSPQITVVNQNNNPTNVKVSTKTNINSPKIFASKKIFQRTLKIKKYTVTIKNSKAKIIKNAKVTLKLKGKTYKTKTNKKGKATFKIKNLKKKGTYKATITYKKIKRTVKIIVK